MLIIVIFIGSKKNLSPEKFENTTDRQQNR